MPAKKKARRKPESRTFEQSLAALQQIVEDLENGSLPLSQSLEKYELGVQCLQECHQALSAARQKVELLVRLDEDGQVITEPFDDAPSETVTRGVRRSTTVDAADQDDDEDDEEFEDDEDSLF